MKQLQALNKHTAPKSVMPEKIIQFGEGNFLRAFVDWIIWNMDAKTNFNGSVVVVRNGRLAERAGLPVSCEPARTYERGTREHP